MRVHELKILRVRLGDVQRFTKLFSKSQEEAIGNFGSVDKDHFGGFGAGKLSQITDNLQRRSCLRQVEFGPECSLGYIEMVVQIVVEVMTVLPAEAYNFGGWP